MGFNQVGPKEDQSTVNRDGMLIPQQTTKATQKF